MTTLRSKAFNFPATGDFKCELTLIETWNGAYIVKVQGDERGIHSKNMEKPFTDINKAKSFYDEKDKTLSEAA